MSSTSFSDCLRWCLLLVAHRQPYAQQTPPPPGPPRPFTLPTPTTITLANGVKATFIDFGAVPKVTVAISVRVGALNDGERTWLSDLTAELMKEGTANESAEQISDSCRSDGWRGRYRRRRRSDVAVARRAVRVRRRCGRAARRNSDAARNCPEASCRAFARTTCAT